MNPINNTFSIAIVGAWNPSIFSPEWVKTYLVTNEQSKVQIAFPLNDPLAPQKISFEDIDIFPDRQKISIISSNPDTTNIDKCSQILVKILKQLAHTPVLSVGINYNFTEQAPSEKMQEALLPSDSDSILNDYQIEVTKIDRVLKRNNSDAYILNFSLIQNDDHCILSFNFHYDSINLDQCKELFSTNIANEHLDTATKFSNNLYDTTFELSNIEE